MRPKIIENSLINLNKVRVALVTPIFTTQNYYTLKDPANISEMKILTLSAGWEILFECQQKLIKPNQKTVIGSGKLIEIKNKILEYNPDRILIGVDITPTQARNLESFFKKPVFDRSALVLEIFEKHAMTAQAKLQVELAKLRYQLPRLSGLWTHLDRERGGSQVSKGMGERQINIDRTLLNKRINLLNLKLIKIASQNEVQTKLRRSQLKICLAGYTNVGKSALMRKITTAKVQSKNQMFTTLTTTTRVLKSKFKPSIVVSDTVGFIKNIPQDLLKAFRTTLNAILEADLLLHVCDISTPDWREKMKDADDIFNQIGADAIKRLNVFSKVDLADEKTIFKIQKTYPQAILVNSYNNQDTLKLKEKIENTFKKNFLQKNISLNQDEYHTLNYIYKNAIIEKIEYTNNKVNISVTMRKIEWQKLDKKIIGVDQY